MAFRARVRGQKALLIVYGQMVIKDHFISFKLINKETGVQETYGVPIGLPEFSHLFL